MSDDVAILVEDLVVAYEGDPVLWKINTALKYNKMTAIVGPNGAGKSTFLNAILSFLNPISGEVSYYFDGEKTPYKKAKKKIAFVPQSMQVDWDFPTSVFDVVLMGRYGHLKLGQRPSKKDKAIAKENLEKVGMLSFANRQISQLSGGQRQRVFLARAFCEESDIIILDEPLAGVDMKTEKIIMNLLKEETAKGKAVIAVHHDLQSVEEYFNEVIFLNREIITSGDVETAFTTQHIEETYRQDHNIGEVVDANWKP